MCTTIDGLDEDTDKRITAYENEYRTATLFRKIEIFSIYQNAVTVLQKPPIHDSKSDISMHTTGGAIFEELWLIMVESFPGLAKFQDPRAKHAILSCLTKDRLDNILHNSEQK